MARRRGRPSAEEGPAVTRQELLRLAAIAIGRDGLAKASMRGIARDAGVSLATLQNHFRTKEVLWKAVVDELIVPEEEELGTKQVDPVAMVHAVVRHRLASAVRRPGLAGRLLTDGSAEGEVVLDYIIEKTRAGRTRDLHGLAEAVDQGLLRPIDPDAVVALMGIALPALSSSKNAVRKMLSRDLEHDEDRERLAAAIADILLFGLVPRGGA